MSKGVAVDTFSAWEERLKIDPGDRKVETFGDHKLTPLQTTAKSESQLTQCQLRGWSYQEHVNTIV